MHRRDFLASLGVIAAAPMLGAGIGTAPRVDGLVCTPFDMFGVQQCEAGIDSAILDVTAGDPQHASQWCWAACIEAIFSYHGHAVSQERIVEATWGRLVNNPGSPAQILGALNRRWSDDAGGEFWATASAIGTNAVTAAQDLAYDHPLIIGTMGHAMVLSSLTYNRDLYGRGQVVMAEVRDPWPDSPGHRTLSGYEWAGILFAARIRVRDV